MLKIGYPCGLQPAPVWLSARYAVAGDGNSAETGGDDCQRVSRRQILSRVSNVTEVVDDTHPLSRAFLVVSKLRMKHHPQCFISELGTIVS
jgi:hypothetical protein